MSSEVCRLSDIANIQGGYAFKSADFGDSGVAVVKIANIQPPIVSLNGVDRVRPEVLDGLDRFRLKDGDILMAMTGATVGKVARFKETEPAYLNQRVARISSKTCSAIDDFIYAVVSLPGFDSLIEGASVGSAQANVSAGGIGSVRIASLKEDEQIEIGKITKQLDDRIALLRETNVTLEAIAQALFKSWFVDFDPVRAKMEGRAPEGMDEATAALFPDSFEESELGLVPKGWRVGALGEELKIAYGKNLPTTKLLDSGYPVYGGNGQIGFFDKYLYETRQVLIACRGAASGKVNQSPPRAFVTNNSLVLESGKGSRLPFEYLKYYMLKSNLTPFVTGSAQPQVTIDNLKVFKLLVPSDEVLSKFESISSDFENRTEENLVQVQILEELRDTLLPRLISGQLRLSDG